MQDTRVHDGMVGEGVGFERIRRITGYPVQWTAGTTRSAQKNATA